MKPGDAVRVLDVHDNRLLRVVVDHSDGFVYVCRREEMEKALAEGREPNCIGFPESTVIVDDAAN